ncbi:MAG TPA: hypothetical protein VHM26_08195 [Chitinophagaceae bacterium]|jgi:tetratricopeptide (TPR) repeat protein|nr:hypothetical protein [Chitinophagaceae bacterium]
MRLTAFILTIIFLAGCTNKKKVYVEKLYRELRIHDSLGHYDSSLKLSSELMKLAPKDLRAFIAHAKAVAALGDTAAAIAELDQIILKHPNDQAYLLKAFFYIGTDNKQTVNFLHEALVINPDLEPAYGMLAQIYTFEIENRDSALHYVHILEQRKADDFGSLIVFQNAYLKYGPPEKLLASTTRLIEKKPKEPYPYNNRGFAEIKLRMFDEARRDILNSLSIDPTNSFAYKNLGLLFIELKQKDSACFYLQTANAKGFKENFGNEVDRLIRIHCQ